MTRATANKTPEKKVVARGTDSADAPAPKKAGTYLRVSTASQVNTDYNPEGISLPFQRGQCELKSVELGAYVAREFLDPGSSATSIDKREVFQEMIAWAKEEGDVDYLICYHFNRMFRNSVDAGLTRRELAKCGTRIVSTVVDLGEGPESDMVETILSAVDEYQSAASGADIAYKMAAKARNGGTLGKAPLGYVNRRDTSEGRNIGISVLDEERAPFVKVAFELYATRKWSLEALQDELTERGLRTRGGRFPVGPVSVSKLAEMLRDPYYAGYVRYKGEIFNGRHEPLISQNLFDQVQAVMDERSERGTRQRRHHHFLKGMLWCGRCHEEDIESRMLMQWSSGNGGRYRYFFCRRRQQHQCDSRYLEGDAVEACVERAYESIWFDTDLADRLRAAMRDALDERQKAEKTLARQLKAELRKLDKQEENLIDLAAEGGMAVAKVRQRLAEIKRKRDLAASRLNGQIEQLEVGVRLIEGALQLLSNAADMYLRMPPEGRQKMNQAVFEKIYVFDGKVTAIVFNPPFGDLLGAQEVGKHSPTYERRAFLPVFDWSLSQAGPENLSEPLAEVLFGDGLSKKVMVEVNGLEPSTSTLRT
jgi:site-specific DNA recombinase